MTAPAGTSTVSSPASTSATTSAVGLEPRPRLPPLVDGEAAACLPLCATGRINDRELPAARYQTLWFFDGAMTVDLDTPWALWEDSTGEFSAGAGRRPRLSARVLARRLPGRGGGPGRRDSQHRDRLARMGTVRSGPRRLRAIKTTIGELPATAVDVAISKAAVNDDPGCPAPVCHNFLGFPQWGESFGIAGDDPYRLWFADVSYSGTAHVLVAALESRDPDHFARFLPVAEKSWRRPRSRPDQPAEHQSARQVQEERTISPAADSGEAEPVHHVLTHRRRGRWRVVPRASERSRHTGAGTTDRFVAAGRGRPERQGCWMVTFSRPA